MILADLPAALDKFAEVVIPALEKEVRDQFALALWLQLPYLSPVGSAARGDPHPGKYRASHTISASAGDFKQLGDLPSYPIPGGDEALAVLQDVAPELPVYEGNAVPASDTSPGSYAAPLEAGWSAQAPGGIYGPAVEFIAGSADQLIERAIGVIDARIDEAGNYSG